jgi:hypothetical protein
MTFNNPNSEQGRVQEETRRNRDYSLSAKSWTIANDFEQMGKNAIEQAFEQKRQELRKELGKLKIEDNVELAKYEQAIMNSLQGRLNLAISVQKDRKSGKIVTDAALDAMEKDVILKLKSANIPALLLDLDVLPERLKDKYRKEIVGEVKPDTYMVLEKLIKGNGMEGKDWELVVSYVRNMQNLKGNDAAAFVLMLQSIKQKDRYELLKRLKDDKNFPDLMMAMVENGYVTVSQCQEMLQGEIKRLGDDKELKNLLSRIGDPAIAERVEKQEKINAERIKYRSERRVGHFLSARRILTYKGIAGLLVGANGWLTMAANFAVDPKLAVVNPMFWFGAAQAVAGGQLSEGLGGTVKTPDRMVRGIFKDKDAEKDAERAAFIQSWKSKVKNRPQVARIYVTFAEKIFSVYNNKVKTLLRKDVPLTLEEIGVSYKDLPEEIRRTPKKKIEEDLSEWARVFPDVGGVGPASQREFIQTGPNGETGVGYGQVEPLDKKLVSLPETPNNKPG